MEPTLFRYIIRHSLPDQLRLTALTLLAFPFLYLSLELPKTIINRAIQPEAGFPARIAWLDSDLDQVTYLLLLCAAFLILVCVNGGFKYAINVYSGVVGERMLRRLRYTLFRRVLRFPLAHFRKVGQGEVVAMVAAETEPLSGFIGESVKVPVFQGGTLLTILVFMFVQDWVLGSAAILLYPVQAYLVPRLQRKLNRLRRDIVVEKRRLAERIGEVVAGAHEVHAHDTAEYEGALYTGQMDTLYRIRLAIFRRKFLIKFLNNFLAQVTPFFFYSIGGYLVIRGDLTFGALVAVLAAHKDLNAPWKELLDYYQQKEDARTKYELLYETFRPEGMMATALGREPPQPLPHLAGELIASQLDLREDGREELAGTLSFRLTLPARVAILGRRGSGAERIGGVLARLHPPLRGTLSIGGMDLFALPEGVTGRRIGYLGPEVRLRTGSLLDNLIYALQHRPQRPAPTTVVEAAERERAAREARLTGNSAYDERADWVDYEAAGSEGRKQLVARAVESLTIADLDYEVYSLGLQGVIDPVERAPLAERIMQARSALRSRLEAPELSGLVEPFDRDAYIHNMTVAENLLFGTPRDPDFDSAQLAENAYVRKVLHETDLMTAFLSMGRELAELMVDLFADVAPDSELFEQFSFISAEDSPEFRNLLSRTAGRELAAAEGSDRRMLLALPFKLVPARHRLGLIDEEMQGRILAAREVLARGFDHGAPPVDFFDPQTYNARGTIQDNILFGRLVYGRARSTVQVGALIREVVQAQGLVEPILEVGLDQPVGIGGSRLSTAERQKLALARCVLKRPDILIVDDAPATLDAASRDRILHNLLAERAGRTLIWVGPHATVARHFDTVLVLEGGRVVEQGSHAELDRPGTLLRELLGEQ